jgi:ATPases with chaperone activity, ATP-binding subunit
MFERYTESARRVIFFARYEASNYGSHSIETEHLLLGLLREDYGLKKWFPDSAHLEEGMRADIEKRITRGERISTSVEIPISAECKRVLNLAAETAERLSHRRIEPAHLLVGLLLVENSIAGQLLIARGLQPGLIREALAKSPSPIYRPTAETRGLLALIIFLDGLRVSKAAQLIDLFAGSAEFIDSLGRVWIREDIWKGFDTLFAPYAKKNAAYAVEATPVDAGEVFVGRVLWKNALLASEERIWMHQMTVLLVLENEDWLVRLIHVTPVQTT